MPSFLNPHPCLIDRLLTYTPSPHYTHRYTPAVGRCPFIANHTCIYLRKKIARVLCICTFIHVRACVCVRQAAGIGVRAYRFIAGVNSGMCLQVVMLGRILVALIRIYNAYQGYRVEYQAVI